MVELLYMLRYAIFIAGVLTLLVSNAAIRCEEPSSLKVIPPEIDDLAYAALTKARSLEEKGQFIEAMETLDRALLLVQGDDPRPSGPASVLLADAARVSGKAGHFPLAASLSLASVKMKFAIYPPDKFPAGHQDLLIALSNTADAMRRIGQYQAARQFAQTAFEMGKRIYHAKRFPQGHPHMAMIANSLGVLEIAEGNNVEAVGFLDEAIKIARHVYPRERFPNGHPELVLMLTNRARAAHLLGEWHAAELMYREAKHMAVALHRETASDPLLAPIALVDNNWGALASERANHVQAYEFYTNAVSIYRKLFPAERFPIGHPELAIALHNLAITQEALGETTQAIQCAEEAVTMLERLGRVDGEDLCIPETALAWETSARLERVTGDLHKVELASRRALEIRQRVFSRTMSSAGEIEIARSLMSLASLAQSKGNFDEAAKHLTDACQQLRKLSVRHKGSSSNRIASEQLARGLNNLALLEAKIGSTASAGEHLAEALRIQVELYPPQSFPLGHENINKAQANYGRFLLGQGEFLEGIERVKQAYAAFEKQYETIAWGLSEGEGMNLRAVLPRLVDDLLSHGQSALGSDEKLYELIWRHKGIRNDLLRDRFRQLRATPDIAIQQKFETYLQLRRDIACHYRSRGSQGDYFSSLHKRKETLERELASSLYFPSNPLEAGASVRELRKLLAANTAVVECFVFHNSTSKRAEYAAFILTRDQPIQRVNLGSCEQIDASIRQWRTAIESAPRQAEDWKKLNRYLPGSRPRVTPFPTLAGGSIVADKVWQPIASALPQDCELVYMLPDGALHFVPWPAIPIEAGKKFLIEELQILHAPSVPWLLQSLRHQTPSKGPDRLLAVGGIFYDEEPLQQSIAPSRAPIEWESRQAEMKYWHDSHHHFLAGSAMESHFLAHCADRREKILLHGRNASLETTTAALLQCRVALISTHGVFLQPPGDEPALALDSREILDQRERSTPWERSPLMRLRLDLSGSSSQTENSQKGSGSARSLTAEHIASLPLSNLQLIILSACQTGLGDIDAGEEMYGFANAFHLAGTRNVITTQWSVNDYMTARLTMLTGYHLYREAANPRDALRLAQLAYLRSPQATLLWDGTATPPQIAERSTASADTFLRHPYYWAAFSLSGPGD